MGQDGRDAWLEVAGYRTGFVLETLNKGGRMTGQGMTAQAVYGVVNRTAGGWASLSRRTTCGGRLPSWPIPAMRRSKKSRFRWGMRPFGTTEKYLGEIFMCFVTARELLSHRSGRQRFGSVEQVLLKAVAFEILRQLMNQKMARLAAFESRTGHIEKSSLRKRHRKAITPAKLEPFNLYTFRHTCLTRWAAYMDPYTLAYLAGQSDFSTKKR